MTVYYYCPKCGGDPQSPEQRPGVQLRARRPDEPVMEWVMFAVMPAVTKEHTRQSLLCDQELLAIWMPCDEGDPESVGLASARGHRGAVGGRHECG